MNLTEIISLIKKQEVDGVLRILHVNVEDSDLLREKFNKYQSGIDTSWYPIGNSNTEYYCESIYSDAKLLENTRTFLKKHVPERRFEFLITRPVVKTFIPRDQLETLI